MSGEAGEEKESDLGGLEKEAKIPINPLALTKWAVVGFALVALLVFALPYLGQLVPGISRTYLLDGMRIESPVVPREGLAKILLQDPQIVRQEMFNESDFRNSVVIIISSEAIRSIANANRRVYSYVAAYDAANATNSVPQFYGCNENNSNCGTPTILVRYGPCNCLRIDPEKPLLTIEGDNAFIGDYTGKLGGILGLVMAQIKNDSSIPPIPTAPPVVIPNYSATVIAAAAGNGTATPLATEVINGTNATD